MNDNQELKSVDFILRPDSEKSWSKAMDYITKHEGELLALNVTHMGKTRTLTQNACIHKYCTMLAIAFNEAGIYRNKKLFGHHIELPWTMAAVKEDIWHPVQFAMYPQAVNDKGEPSSSKLNTSQVSEVYKVISQNVAQSKGVDVPWPSNRG